jgi:hypothetical protein
MMTVAPPLNIVQLQERMEQVSVDLGITVARVKLMLSTLIVSQMLPDAVAVKGGMGIKLRLGEVGTRATADLDVAAAARDDQFQEAFRARLAAGWGVVPPSKGQLKKDANAPQRVAFTATLRAAKPHDPGVEHPQYLMHPYRVTISFLGSSWAGLDVEVADPEVGHISDTEKKLDSEIVQFAERFGFGVPEPVRLLELEQQIAQKIHALTDVAYTRAHDLVDLQLLLAASPDLRRLRELCVSTFAWRNQHGWPPLPLRTMEGWERPYFEARAETEIEGESSVLSSLAEARDWFGTVVASIEAADVSASDDSQPAA